MQKKGAWGSSTQYVFFKSQEMGLFPSQEIRIFCICQLSSYGVVVGWGMDADLLQYLAVCELCMGRSELTFFKSVSFFLWIKTQHSTPYLICFGSVKALLHILIACHPRIDRKLQNLSRSVLLNQIRSEFFVLLLFVCLFHCDLIRI